MIFDSVAELLSAALAVYITQQCRGSRHAGGRFLESDAAVSGSHAFSRRFL